METSMNVDASRDSESDLSSLCGLASFVTNSPETLTIGRKLSADEVSVLCSVLISGSEIFYLAIREELPAGAGTAVDLGSAIPTASTIRTLSLGRTADPSSSVCKPAPELFRILASTNSATLEQLTLYGLCINDFCNHNSFGRFTALCSLTIHAGKDCSRSLPSLAASIVGLRALESLHLCGIVFTNSGAEMLVAALKSLPLIVELGICYAELRAGRLIGNLVAMSKIHKLDLSGNEMKDEEITAMVNAILGSRRCGLQELILAANWISLEGERKVADLVSRSPHLRVLDLQCNFIDETFLNTAVAAKSLEELKVSNCSLLSHAVESMIGVAGAFPALRVLSISYNRMEDQGARAIAQFIAASGGRTLTKLGMRNVGITKVGALELAGAFSKAYECEQSTYLQIAFYLTVRLLLWMR